MTRAILTLLAAVAVTACGKIGPLDQPAPLYGDKAKAKYEAEKAAAAQATAGKNDAGAPESLPGDPAYDVNADPAPQRTLPIPGTNPSPNGPAPQGALPDPFNHPQ